jgi:hypothetical protein
MERMDEEVTQVRPPPIPPPLATLARDPAFESCRLVRPLGEGYSSEIYEAENLVARKPCALKLFRRELGIGVVNLGRYVHECTRVSQIAHPALAEVYSTGTAEGRVYSLVELAPGTDLRTLVRKSGGPLSRRTYLPIARALCEAIAALHAHGLAHRHLHSGQVMVLLEGAAVSVKLLDMGVHHFLPKVKEQVQGLRRRPEDAASLSPEQAKGQEGDSKSDLYALSAILYEMTTGRAPFLGETFAETAELHLSQAPTPPSQLVHLPAEVEEVILRGLEKDPRQRTPSVEALLAGIDPSTITATGQHAAPGKSGSARHAAVLEPHARELTRPEEAERPAAAPHPAEPAPRPAAAPPARPAGRAAPPPSPRASGRVASPLPPPPSTSRLAPLEEDVRLVVPKSRTWLYALLGVVVLGCIGIVGVVLLGGDKGQGAGKKAAPAEAKKGAATANAKFVTGQRDTRVFLDGKLIGTGEVVRATGLSVGKHTFQIQRGATKSVPRSKVFLPNRENVCFF